MANVTGSDKLIRLSDSQYPIFLSQVRQDNKLVSLPQEPTEEQLLELGYVLVQKVTPPTGDVVTEGTPTQVSGVWTQTWNVRAYTTEELATQLTQKKAELSDRLTGSYTQGILEQGIAYDFGGTYGTLHIQVRDGDRANLVGLRVNADAAVAASLDDDAHAMYFRTLENVNVPLKPSAVITMTNAALVGYYNVLQPIWALKDQITSATELSQLPTF